MSAVTSLQEECSADLPGSSGYRATRGNDTTEGQEQMPVGLNEPTPHWLPSCSAQGSQVMSTKMLYRMMINVQMGILP